MHVWKGPCFPRLLPSISQLFSWFDINITSLQWLVSLANKETKIFCYCCLAELIATTGFTSMTKFLSLATHFSRCYLTLLLETKYENLGAAGTKVFSLKVTLCKPYLNFSPKTTCKIATNNYTLSSNAPKIDPQESKCILPLTYMYCTLLKSGKTLDLLFPW